MVKSSLKARKNGFQAAFVFQAAF
jgi:hypothetical protein